MRLRLGTRTPTYINSGGSPTKRTAPQSWCARSGFPGVSNRLPVPERTIVPGGSTCELLNPLCENAFAWDHLPDGKTLNASAGYVCAYDSPLTAAEIVDDQMTSKSAEILVALCRMLQDRLDSLQHKSAGFDSKMQINNRF